jgi:membrane protease subunit (stomatin/prohibitin family)
MGLLNMIKNQLIDVIEWPEQEPGILVHRFNRHDNEIKMGAKLIVRPGQKAVFVNEGKIADGFDPGTYTLSTQNMPFLTTLLSLPYGFTSPFKAEVYFVKTTEQLDRKWGTPNPVMLRDQDFGMVRLRARGNYSYKVGIREEMISRFVGAQSEFAADSIEEQIRVKVISSFSDCLGELKIAALDLASKYDEISNTMHTKLTQDFIRLGLELLSFTLENISLPDEVQKAMDERASMGAIGNLNNYSQYQAANALREAANNQGEAGNLMGMMLGTQMAGGISNSLIQQQNTAAQTIPPPVPGQSQYFAVIAGQQAGPFNMAQLQEKINKSEISKETLLWKQGMPSWEKADAISELINLFDCVPPPIPGK